MTLAGDLSNYLGRLWPQRKGCRVENIRRFTVGAAQETCRFDMIWGANGEQRQGLVMRREMPDAIIQTERRTEYAALRAFAASDVPVPEVFALEEDPAHLGAPFMIMEEIAGCESAPYLLDDPRYDPVRARMGHRKWQILGQIAGADPTALGLDTKLRNPGASDCWKVELDYWSDVLRTESREIEPASEAAIRWLEANPPPPPPRMVVVHGDFRTGNFLYTERGEIHAVLDWEMCHIGDPHEDIAWAMVSLWAGGRDDRPGRLIGTKDALKTYTAASGISVDPKALGWWRLFATIKAMAIWKSSGRIFADGKSDDPMMVRIGWLAVDAQRRETVRRLADAKGDPDDS